ncbi:MAG: hypothetical protein WAU01_11730 [Saprospiraceae bacterium]
MSEKFQKIGSVLKPVGTLGEIKVNIDDDFVEDFVVSDHFFVRINGAYVPYFIEDIRETNHLLIKIEEVDSPEDASVFTLKDIFLSTHKITSTSYSDQKDKSSLVGYSVKDYENDLGVIQEVNIFPKQIMATIVGDNQKSMLIPLADGLISSIDRHKRCIYMELPEGLREL